jgi:hypothetical protein
VFWNRAFKWYIFLKGDEKEMLIIASVVSQKFVSLKVIPAQAGIQYFPSGFPLSWE